MDSFGPGRAATSDPGPASDPGHTGPTPHETIACTPPATIGLRRDRTFLGLPATRVDGKSSTPALADPATSRQSAHRTVVRYRNADGSRDVVRGSVVVLAAGARAVVRTGLSTTHVQGTARMGDDPARWVVAPTRRSHDVAGLYVGDASQAPASLSVNPSLTVMALAARVVDALLEELP